MATFAQLKQHIQSIPDYTTQRALMPWLDDYEGRNDGTIARDALTVTGAGSIGTSLQVGTTLDVAGGDTTLGANLEVQGNSDLQNGVTMIGEVWQWGQTGYGLKLSDDMVSADYGWHDITAPILTRTGGGTSPTYASYIGNIYQWSFPNTGAKECFQEFHLPHDLVPNSSLYIHTHWSTIVLATGNARWVFECTYAKGHDQAIFQSPVVITVADAGTSAFRHLIAEVQLSASGGELSIGSAAVTYSITASAATLTSSAEVFTSADIGRTIRIRGAGAAGVDLDTTISGFTSTTEVTVADNASTTVTTVADAAVWRVLDSDNTEPDGMILVRTSRDSAATADTIDQVPFLHTVDIHYQSTGIPTKNRSPSFWSA